MNSDLTVSELRNTRESQEPAIVDTTERSTVLASMFCLGFVATLLQVTFMREMLVAVFGNEISIGVILGNWLICISLGAFAARPVVHRLSSRQLVRLLFSWLFLVPAVLAPFEVYAIRALRTIMDVPMGEYAPLGSIAAGSFLIFLPLCFCIGFCFPLACRALELEQASGEGRRPTAVSLVYTLEALGSMVGGVILTVILLRFLTPLRLVVLTSAIALVGAALAMPVRRVRCFFVVLAAILTAGVFAPGCMDRLEERFVERRWASFGVISQQSEEGWPALKLVDSEDSIYQNLAVTESEGQYALYGNGEVIFTFPDPYVYEHEIHFLMAQKPDAGRVLLLGGNPLGEIPELLKYPLDRLVYVELDSAVGRMVSRIMPVEYRETLSDPRLECVEGDAVDFIKRCEESFDVVLVNAPQPSTTALNRFYTVEFYSDLKRLLNQGGFVACGISSAERLRSEAVQLGASVYQALAEVFDVVLVTAESRNRFLAGDDDSGLTFARRVLFEKSRASAIDTEFFRPELFLGSDEITPEKVDIVLDRFTSQPGLANRMLKPVTYFYNLVLWSRFSGSALESVLAAVQGPRARRTMCWGALGVAMLVLLAGGALIRTSGQSNARRCWRRIMVASVIATTGFCGMALEIVLIFVFQGLFGYIYMRMGLIVAAFMLGLVIGAPSGRRMASGTARSAWLSLVCVDIFLLVFPLLVAALVSMGIPAGAFGWSAAEGSIYLAVAIAGWAVGAEFPLANRAYLEARSSASAAAAITDASDHIGAAVGCMVMGVVLIPVMGISGSCLLLAGIKGVSLACLVSTTICKP
jgi:spermidine synthase